MRTFCLIIPVLLLAGCVSGPQSASLTAEQATSIALRLANDKADQFFHHRPFQNSQPAQFVAGHWVWVEQQGVGHVDLQATVELAADGSTNNVSIKLLDNQNERVF